MPSQATDRDMKMPAAGVSCFGAGFIAGAGVRACCQARAGRWSLAVPAELALVALAVTYCPLASRNRRG